MTRKDLIGYLVLLLGGSAAAQQVDYVRQVKPILEHHCYACHGALKQKGGLRLDTGGDARRGGESGPAVVASKPAASALLDRVRSQDDSERMPQEGRRLTAAEIAILQNWIEQGAKSPEKERRQSDPRQHWSYHPPKRPPLPDVKNRDWVRNSVDTFILAALEKRGIAPQRPASRHVLLRRVYIDLVGVPPDTQALQAFLADDKPDAYERVVERLLNSPQYGERWGRHWMDVWRYSDWYGRRASNEIRYSQRHIWRWRDWIIESANADKGYDRMLTEMFAGDEVAPADKSTLRATGFLGRNWYKFDRDAWLFETVEQTSLGVLGLTMKCARCHDHKYDPITQEDYYRFRAFFEPHAFRTEALTASVATEIDNGKAQVLKDGLSRAYDANLEMPTYRLMRGDARSPDKSRRLTPAVPAIFGQLELPIRAIALPLEAFYPALAPQMVAARQSQLNDRIQRARAVLADCEGKKSGAVPLRQAKLKLAIAEAERRSYEARRLAELARYEGSENADESRRLARHASKQQRELAKLAAQGALSELQTQIAALGSPSDPAVKKKHASLVAKEKAAAAALSKAEQAAKGESEKYDPLGPTYPRTSSGRRRALATWLTDRSNPRTARVAVNHVWLRHFGRALVGSVADFGVRSQEPTHPQLLDWLAVEFMDNEWRWKPIHRLIVTSSVYRMSSSAEGDDRRRTLDPENQLLWRMNTRRMEAEVVRDSLLAISGQIDHTMGGPDLDDNLGQTSARRSLYFRTTPDNRVRFLEFFDLANPNACYERTVSIVPQQALALTNSPMGQRQSRLLARALYREAASEADGEFTRRAFWRVLSRPPNEVELSACVDFLRDQQRLLADVSKLTPYPPTAGKTVAPSADPRLRARENLIHVLFSHHDFVTIR